MSGHLRTLAMSVLLPRSSLISNALSPSRFGRAGRARPRRNRTASRSRRCDGRHALRGCARCSRRGRDGASPTREASPSTCLRWRFSCDPHRVQGMIGNCRSLRVRREIGLLARRRAAGSRRGGRRRRRASAASPSASRRRTVQEERLEDVVAVVPERDLRRAELARDAVEHAAPQPRAQRAHRLPFRDDALHHRVGVLHRDAVTGRRSDSRYSGSTCSGIARAAAGRG